MDATRVYFNGTVDDLFEFVVSYLKQPSVPWPEAVMLGPGDKTEKGWRLTFVEPRFLTDEEKREHAIPDHATGAVTDGPRIGWIDIERITDQQARLVCKPLTDDCRVFTEALAQYVTETPGAELRPAVASEPASTKAAGEQPDDRLDPVDRKIIEVVHKIESEGRRATDELVALRLPVLSPKTGEPYSRKTINMRRIKLRGWGYDV